ncbi:Hypothetical protein R9X50_00122700 [Acrodontium crateriforme]|uniref:C6 transcription factor n=1 Tax=Acrodontium crateriforme TaxID=150365 RepID=A0AAQ3R9W4_9PEZI|nr:Hypothetical protein R9X50_00122700 [Acrodontium crateriforme]
MVATRNHPKEFQTPPTESPTKRSTRTSSGTTPARTRAASPPDSAGRASSSTIATRARTSSPTTWSHTPSNLTLGWLAISLPLVMWDTGYVLLRPYTMPGGILHKPIWAPYELYGTIDHVYGWKAYHAKSGWTAAQGSVNAIETLAYFVYLYIVYTHGKPEKKQGRGAPELSTLGKLAESRTVTGRMAALAVLIAYTAATVTFWKTVLYWLIEALSGFDNIGHNTPIDLLFLWIIPNGAWLVLPLYMTYVYGAEIIQGLTMATGEKKTQ